MSLGCPSCPSPSLQRAWGERPAPVVLISGSGTLLQALIDACADPAYGAQDRGRRLRSAGHSRTGAGRADRHPDLR